MASSNFAFLKGVDDFLFTIARAAEQNYPDDPNTTLVKLRQFGESMAKHLATLFRIELAENQHELLKEFGKIKGFDDTVLTAFHKLRKIGNQAVHEYHNDLQDAEMCLRISYRLAIWFYRLVKKEFDFAAPVFVLPTSAQSNDYSQEVAALKEALKLAQQQLPLRLPY